MRNCRLCLLILLWLLAFPALVTADIQFGVGCMIQTTPFYNKLVQAGVFEIPAMGLANPRPMPLLFKMARSFRYESDKTRRDWWQSADQTSQYFSGDCEDKAIWLYTQMRRNGYHDASLHIGKYSPSSRKFHMWVTYVADDGSTLLLDPTIQRKPWNILAFSENFYRSLHILNGSDCVSL